MSSLINQLFPAAEPHFREGVPADAEALAELHAAAFARGWEAAEFERLLTDAHARTHVAVDGPRGRLIGFVLSHVVPPEAEILSIAIAARRRGEGLGRRLLLHHLSRLAAAGITTSFLEVEEGNAPACALYARLGYREVGRRRGYYGASGADALLLRRDF